MKSDPYPTSIQKARWTVVSTSISTMFANRYNSIYESDDLFCTVDDNEVFMFIGQYNGTGRESYRFDPLTAKGSYYDTFRKNSTGEWDRLSLSSDNNLLPYATALTRLYCSVSIERSVTTIAPLRSPFEAATALSLWSNTAFRARGTRIIHFIVLQSSTRHSTAWDLKSTTKPRIWRVFFSPRILSSGRGMIKLL